MDQFPNIAIIGPGRVGTAIGILANRAQWPVVAVAGGSTGAAEAAAAAIGECAGACSVTAAAGAGELVLIAVPDDRIADLCTQLARKQAFTPGTIVAHCSGALSSEVLASARDECCCLIGSMHPLQTFPTVEAAVGRLPGSWCFCEGDETAVTCLMRLAEAIGARAARITPGGKAVYHAAAVMACNYLVTLMDAAADLARQAGLDRQTWLSAVEPIVRATVENVSATGPEKALTGPVARGDIQTVRRHLDALAGADEGLRRLYAACGLRTVELALRAGRISAEAAAEMTEMFRRSTPGGA
jgi:predicted short-subunit dehydrogenase-like oxidoreductase (DUF2520 family)